MIKKAFFRIWFPVSLKLAGGFLAWKFPKWLMARAAAVVLWVPLSPYKKRAKAGVISVAPRNSRSGARYAVPSSAIPISSFITSLIRRLVFAASWKVILSNPGAPPPSSR